MLQTTLALPRIFWKVQWICVPYRIPLFMQHCISGAVLLPPGCFWSALSFLQYTVGGSALCSGLCVQLQVTRSHYVRGTWAFASVISLLPSSKLDPPFPVHLGVGADLTLPSTHVGSMVHVHCNERTFCCQDMKSSQHRTKPREISRWGSFSDCSLFYFPFLRFKEAQEFVFTSFSPIFCMLGLFEICSCDKNLKS